MNWDGLLSKEGMMLLFSLLGGLALFLLGMETMSAGLRTLAGKSMRGLIHRATRNRFSGLMLGSGIGFLIQSSAATVMLVGFVNAGLLRLPQAVPLVFGVNIGTTLSMQLISFKISEYCFVAIGLGFLLKSFAPGAGAKIQGQTLLGFGLLFLGMDTMSAAILPYRDSLAPMMLLVDGGSLSGALAGVALAAGLTAVIQSSGATIGMVFTLIHAGVITSLPGAYPMVVGAGIGTCVTALLGSIGTGIQAKRTAVSHLVFNVFSVGVALAVSPWMYAWIPRLTGDVVHQAANANMIRMILSALILLPLSGRYAKFIEGLMPSRQPEPEPSHLDGDLLRRPEKAIAACILELKRVAGICEQNLLLHAELFRSLDRKTIHRIMRNEEVVNEVKRSMDAYVLQLSLQRLSKRQAVMIQYLNRGMSHLERVGDHVDRLREITVQRLGGNPVLFSKDLLEAWFELYGSALKSVRLTRASLDPELKDFQKTAETILLARDEYMERSRELRSRYNDRLAGKNGDMSAAAGIYMTKYLDGLDRIVGHIRTIALLQKNPEFWIKRKKLDRVAGEAPKLEQPDLVDVSGYLDKLQSGDS